MEVLNNTIIEESLIEIHYEAIDKFEAIKKMVSNLFNKNLVKQNFLDEIILREEKFPTGLNFDGYSIAIPHTDQEFVNNQAISIMTLKNPVEFTVMATDDEKTNVDIIVMLAIKEKEKQVIFLKALMDIFIDKDKANSLINASSKKELLEKFINYMNEVK